MSSTAAPSAPIKQANKPFLVQKKYKEDQVAKKAAGGSNGGGGGALLSLLKWMVLALLTSVFLSRMVTETWLWGYEGQYSHPSKVISKLFPPKERILSEYELSLHDGTKPEYPTYVGIDGEVYDVSSSAMYGPSGGYGIFAGKDAARAFSTGCFKTHLTHDVRGLAEKELKGLAHWKQFFAGHAKYTRVGKVAHPLIDPSTPIPAPCDARAEGGAM